MDNLTRKRMEKEIQFPLKSRQDFELQNNGLETVDSPHHCHDSATCVVLDQHVLSDLSPITRHGALSLFTRCDSAHFQDYEALCVLSAYIQVHCVGYSTGAANLEEIMNPLKDTASCTFAQDIKGE